MNKQDYERLAQYMAFGADDDKPELDYTAARGLFAPADEPAEASIRRLRGTAELPAQVAEHQRVLELERALTAAQQRIEALESERALAVRVAYELCPAETLNHLVFEDAATPYFVNSLVTYGDIVAVLGWFNE